MDLHNMGCPDLFKGLGVLCYGRSIFLMECGAVENVYQ